MTCIAHTLALKHKATNQDGVINFHLCFMLSAIPFRSRLQQSASHNSVSSYIDTRSTEYDSEVSFGLFKSFLRFSSLIEW